MSTCIWLISKYAVIPGPGELAMRRFALMQEIAERGFRSVIITSDSSGPGTAHALSEPTDVRSVKGVTVCRLKTLKYRRGRSLRRIFSWLDFERRLLFLQMEKLPAPDVVVVSSLSLLTILNGVRLQRRFRCRLAFDVEDIWPLVLIEEGGFSRRNPIIFLLGMIEKWGYRRADVIGGTMPNLKAHVEAVTGTARDCYYIPHGIALDLEGTSSPLPAGYVSAYVPTGKFVIGYTGSLGAGNAMDVLFECAESMKDETRIHFLIVGDGYLRKNFLQRFGHLSNVTFSPAIARNQVQDLLSRCDVLYFSIRDSRLYEYGRSLNKNVDYLLAAKPFIASYSGFPMTIAEADCGAFVPAGSVQALRETIGQFASMSTSELDEMGQRGRTWLLENLNYSTLAQTFLDAILPDR